MKELVQRILQETQRFDPKWFPEHIIDETIRIQQIPAPTFQEHQRAKYVEAQFQMSGLKQVQVDSVQNVYGYLEGTNPALPSIMLSAHMDTVFPLETDLSIEREDAVIAGPGIGDNSLAVASLLGVAKLLHEMQITPACGIWFVATTREEGMGNLDGIRAAYNKLKEQIAAVINIEGLSFGYVYNGGIAVKRLQITAHAGGGHTWLHYGRPNAVHGIIELAWRITQIVPPAQPRTTYNISIIEGGQGINVIAPEASIWIDLRSETQEQVDRLYQQITEIVDSVATPELTFAITPLGDRPAGEVERNHPLVQTALLTLEELGIRGATEAGSTDGNIPLADGCPAVTIGITKGGHAHRMDEFIEIEPVSKGYRQLLTLLLAYSEHLESQSL